MPDTGRRSHPERGDCCCPIVRPRVFLLLQTIFCLSPVVVMPEDGMMCFKGGCRPRGTAVCGMVDVRVLCQVLQHPLRVPLLGGLVLWRTQGGFEKRLRFLEK